MRTQLRFTVLTACRRGAKAPLSADMIFPTCLALLSAMTRLLPCILDSFAASLNQIQSIRQAVVVLLQISLKVVVECANVVVGEIVALDKL